MATFLQSQRRRLRGYLGQAWAKMGIEASAEASESPDGTQFCSKCKAISAKLEELFDRGFDGPDGLSSYPGARRVTDEGDLEHVVKLFRRKRCSLCNFLAHMVEAHGVGLGWATSELSLVIGSAKKQSGIPQDFSQVSDSFFLWIWPSRYVGAKWDPLLPYDFEEEFGSSGMALELNNDPGKISGLVVGPQTNFELVRSWFDDCTMRHGNTCQTDTSILQGIPGFRVIDCSSRRLVSWSQLPKNQDCDYVALSYVWGAEPDDENEAKASWPTWFKDAILETRGHKTVEKPKASSDWTTDWRLPSKLPLLIEDAITAVIKLRFRYLWVDRYCIPQENQEAKHTQIQSMDRIYGSASLTIIAAAGNDPSHGLPGVSPRYGRSHKNLSTSVRIESRTFVTVGTGDAPETLKQSKWNSRAWTMQEAFLSCRCLVFLGDGAYFQCSSPRSHRFEAIHEPKALLQLKHEVLSREEHNSTELPDSLILTKVGKAGDLKLVWCLQLVSDYFLRSMTFEDDTLNAFSGILKYLQSLKPPVHNLWGVLMLPEVVSTSSGQRIRYNLVCGLAWSYECDIFDQTGELERITMRPRKEIFPSWTWADWRPKTELDDKPYFALSHHLGLPCQYSSFTCLVDLSVELDDGRIVSWGHGYDSDVLWLTTLPKPPRILHIQGYTSNPQLRYMTEEDWAEFHERTIPPTQEAHAHGRNGHNPKDHWCGDKRDGRRWIYIDADGQHLQLPFELTYREKPWCWGCRSELYDLSTDAYYVPRQRGYQTEAIKPYTESTLEVRVILLGYMYDYVFYMLLMGTLGTDSQTETFERVNVLQRMDLKDYRRTEPAKVEEFFAKLTGQHAESFPGTPWTKMNTRVA